MRTRELNKTERNCVGHGTYLICLHECRFVVQDADDRHCLLLVHDDVHRVEERGSGAQRDDLRRADDATLGARHLDEAGHVAVAVGGLEGESALDVHFLGDATVQNA